MKCKFHVGQKVVCVKVGAWADALLDEIMPINGGIYTIRDMEADSGEVWLRFDEIRNPECPFDDGWYECRFWADNFRPLETRKTSIEIFNQILRGERHPIKVREPA